MFQIRNFSWFALKLTELWTFNSGFSEFSHFWRGGLPHRFRSKNSCMRDISNLTTPFKRAHKKPSFMFLKIFCRGTLKPRKLPLLLFFFHLFFSQVRPQSPTLKSDPQVPPHSPTLKESDRHKVWPRRSLTHKCFPFTNPRRTQRSHTDFWRWCLTQNSRPRVQPYVPPSLKEPVLEPFRNLVADPVPSCLKTTYVTPNLT